MPRKSPYDILLSAEEARGLSRRAAKYTLPYFEVIRAKINLLAAQGLRNDEIAARLNTGHALKCPDGAWQSCNHSLTDIRANLAWSNHRLILGPNFRRG